MYSTGYSGQKHALKQVKLTSENRKEIFNEGRYSWIMMICAS
jgi:hypothetical protein